MTTVVFLGPAPTPSLYSRASISSSSQATPATSSESPNSTTRLSFAVRYVDNGSSQNIIPEAKELDEGDLDIDNVKPSPTEDETRIPFTQGLVKRTRRRPRKHPVTSPSISNKTPKYRSRTGCFTCRRRKKKCDESRPHCLHCQKNNVHCEGYPPKESWRSGKERVGERTRTTARRFDTALTSLASGRLSFDRPSELPILIEGVENEMDKLFLEHFHLRVSKVLTLFTDSQNPFVEILLPMAFWHKGLMHSLLCLSGSHMAAKDPSGEWEHRQIHHFNSAVQGLQTDANMARSIAGDQTAIIDDPTVAQTLVLCLKSITAGEVNGEYRPHMDAAKHLVQTQESPNQDFQSFLLEFFIYHDVSNSVTSLDRKPILMLEDFGPPTFKSTPAASALLGVLDGLFGFLSKTRYIRDAIRVQRRHHKKPAVGYEIMTAAHAIDTGLREWVCVQEPGTPRYNASMLYRQCTWLYLYRTIMPSMPNPNLRNAVNGGLRYLRQLPSDASTQSILLMPVFLLGCAAFEHSQRPEILQAFEGLQNYSNLGNIQYARKVVEKVWEMMDAGDEESWDWETTIYNQGWDFLVT